MQGQISRVLVGRSLMEICSLTEPQRPPQSRLPLEHSANPSILAAAALLSLQTSLSVVFSTGHTERESPECSVDCELPFTCVQRRRAVGNKRRNLFVICAASGREPFFCTRFRRTLDRVTRVWELVHREQRTSSAGGANYVPQ